MAATAAQERMRALIEAGIALSSELSLDAVLQKLVETAAALTGAKYAALGVLDPTGSRLERFLTTGIDAQTHAAIGDLPTGRGILGVLIRDASPLRLHDLSEDPRSVGFPPGHPPMHSFLGVPVALRGIAYGNLYLTEKEGGDFGEEDEETVTLLASQAAVAIENARLYESATRWSTQLESLNEVAAALVSQLELAPLLHIVANRLRTLIAADTVHIALPHADGLRIEAAAGPDAEKVVGIPIPARSKTMRVLERKRTERVDSVIDDPEIDQETARLLEMRTALYVPLVLRGEAIGVITAQDKEGADPRFSAEDVRLAEVFAQRATVAVDLSHRVARDALRRVVSAQEQERRRLARELHDETGQALTSILLGLRTVEEAGGEEEVRAAVAEVRELVRSTLQDVRRLAVELRPKALDDFGLVAALERLTESFTEQTGIAVGFESLLPTARLTPEIETALYRIVQESLTNIVKHAQAHNVSIVLGRKSNSVSVIVEDDGVGFDPDRPREDGLGLIGMRERVSLIGGRLTIESRPGAGTTFIAEVPVS
ncbi:MAG TPA: GAF domain-containing sensor histidine kinase [Gaiellaceae bacterium]|jgi:signal transduction histidine kinase|nr:GAF domain-containing sensor histidine kinase [Gaiellaceae bacterium]